MAKSCHSGAEGSPISAMCIWNRDRTEPRSTHSHKSSSYNTALNMQPLCYHAFFRLKITTLSSKIFLAKNNLFLCYLYPVAALSSIGNTWWQRGETSFRSAFQVLNDFFSLFLQYIIHTMFKIILNLKERKQKRGGKKKKREKLGKC